METQKNVSEIPDFKLAKVGHRRRKGGALPFFFGRGAGAGSGAMGGGAMGTLSAMGGKIAVALLMGCLGVGAYSIGKILAPDSSQFEAGKKKPQLFASANADKPRYEGDLSNLPGGQAPAQSGLSMVSGSLDGLTPEERAAKAKEAQAAAEAQDKADAEAAKQQPDQAGAPTDPAAMAAAAAAAAAQKDKDNNLSRKFGELTKGLGGNLSGGSGMSAGVGRGFDMPKFKSDAGKLLAMGNSRPNVGSAKARPANIARSAGKGLARRQLDNAYHLSNQARKGADESRASYASQPFDNNPAAGNAITGTGAGTGITPAAGSGGIGATPNPVGGGAMSGGAADATPDDCAALFPDGGYISSPAGGCVKAETGKSVDPTDWLFNLLKVLAIIALVISALIVVCALIKDTVIGSYAYAIQVLLCKALIAVGALMTILGLMAVGMGRTVEGGIFALIGALTIIGGVMSLSSGEKASGTQAATDEAAKKAAEKLAQEAALKHAAFVAAGTGAVNTAGSIYGNSVGSRTLNADTQKWE